MPLHQPLRNEHPHGIPWPDCLVQSPTRPLQSLLTKTFSSFFTFLKTNCWDYALDCYRAASLAVAHQTQPIALSMSALDAPNNFPQQTKRSCVEMLGHSSAWPTKPCIE